MYTAQFAVINVACTFGLLVISKVSEINNQTLINGTVGAKP